LNLRPPRPERGALSGQRNDNESPSVFANIQSFRMDESVGADPAWLGVRDGKPNYLSWLESCGMGEMAFCRH
jgi:hypothetical protein